MRDLPIIFPLSLVVLLIVLFFTGVYAVSASATVGQQANISAGGSDNERSIFQQGALFVCPFH